MPLRRFALLWVVQKVSALWIVEQDLWDAVKTRQQTAKHNPKQSGENGIWVRRRARYTVYGKLVPVERSLTEGALPIGLAHGVRLTRDVAAGTMVRMCDVALDQSSVALNLRREMAGKVGIHSAA